MAKNKDRYAILSVSDKTGIATFAKELIELGYKIISTGGTAKILTEEKIPVIPIEKITGNPESFEGRMKTISFPIASALLYDRSKQKHVKEAEKLRIKNIDIAAVNFYPFEESVSKKEDFSKTVENIDIGGPTMVRAGSKNFSNVTVVVDPSDYPNVINAIKKNKLETLRKNLAAKTFQLTSFYDAQVAKYLTNEQFPPTQTLPGRKIMDLRYGENPHQKATVYIEPNTNSPLSKLKKITGRDLSYVNFTDIAAGLEAVRNFDTPAATVIKHNSPSGIALGNSPHEALTRAVEADPESAFGGVIVLNKSIDLKTAKTFASFKEENHVLIDIIAAPGVALDASKFIKTVRKTTGIYSFGKIPKKRSNKNHIKFFDGGFIVQNWDDDLEKSFTNWRIAGKYKPSKKMLEQAKIGWKFISRIRSNTVIIVDPQFPMTRGIGSGQTSRVRATKIALDQAGKKANGAILISDSFFPFDDSVKLAAKHGIKLIVEQGGSINDELSIKAADQARIPIILTGERQFWH